NTPKVQYTYDDSNDLGVYTNGLRLLGVEYPSSKSFGINYGTEETIDDRLSRPQSIRDDHATGTILAEYVYNGTGRVVQVDYPEASIHRQMFSSAGNYDAFDRFGRTVRQQWKNYSGTPTVIDQFKYSHDNA